MTDFILGIFTGISIAILWGMYLNKQREKKEKQRSQAVNHGFKHGYRNALIDVVDEMGQVDPHWIAKVIKDPRTAAEQLQAAIERDDFEEAARLRDLMNKK